MCWDDARRSTPVRRSPPITGPLPSPTSAPMICVQKSKSQRWDMGAHGLRRGGSRRGDLNTLIILDREDKSSAECLQATVGSIQIETALATARSKVYRHEAIVAPVNLAHVDRRAKPSGAANSCARVRDISSSNSLAKNLQLNAEVTRRRLSPLKIVRQHPFRG